jgi:hypothetical protein
MMGGIVPQPSLDIQRYHIYYDIILYQRRYPMKLVRIIVSVSQETKARLDDLKARGLTSSGYIRNVLERDFKAVQAARKAGAQ